MVGIIPKPIKKPSQLYKFSPYIVLGLVAAVVLAFAVLFYLTYRASNSLADVQERIAQVGTEDEKKLEIQLLLDKRQIDDFSKLFASHQQALNFFSFLEENCHPKAWFSKLELDAQKYEAVLTGEAANFSILGQQIALFQAEEFVKNVEISDISIGDSGRVSFTLSLLLDAKILKNNE